MVRNYQRKTTKGSYSKEKLQEAVRAVLTEKLSGYKAAQIYDIPRMTIMDHVNRKRVKSKTLGRNTALSFEVEKNLVSLLHLMEKCGFGLSRHEMLEMVGDYVNKNNLSTPFKNGVPGKDWFLAVKKRHNLSVKKPQGVEYARKKAVDPFIVYPYFDLLERTIDELQLRENPSAIWNLDETSFSKDPEKTKIVGMKGHAATRLISSPGKDNTTVLLGASAAGDKTPPLIIFKGKHMWDQWISPDAYPNTAYAATKNGWMETEVFENFFKKKFLETVGDKRPILLIYDGHSTHVGLNIIEEARKQNITILKLPPHTSHILQPLDISVMKSFKDKWDPLLVKWQRLNVGNTLPKKEFARLIGQVWAQIEPQVLRNGFRKAGICPINREAIPEKCFDALRLQRWKESNTIQEPLEHALNAHETSKPSQEHRTTNQPPSLLSLALKATNNAILESSTAYLSSQNSESYMPSPPKQPHYQIFGNPIPGPSNHVQKIPVLGTSNQIYENPIPGPSNQIYENPIPGPSNQIYENPIPGPSNQIYENPISVPSKQSKIQILDDRAITFEELLLMKVQAGQDKKQKRKKIIQGAEVITHDDVLRYKIEANEKNIKKENKSRITKKNVTEKKDKKCKNGDDYFKEEKIKKENIIRAAKKQVKEKNTKENTERTKREVVTEKQGKKCNKSVHIKEKSSSESDASTPVNDDDIEYEHIMQDFEEDILSLTSDQEEENIKKENKSRITKKDVTENKDKKCKNGDDYFQEEKIKKVCIKKAAKKQVKEKNTNENPERTKKKEVTEKQGKKCNKSTILQKTKTVKPRKYIYNKEKSSSESDASTPVYDDDSEYENMQDFVEDILSLTSDQENENINANFGEQALPCSGRKFPDVGNWLMVQFATKKTIKHYVGVVTKIENNEYPVVKYLRKSKRRSDGTVFKFPHVEDVSVLRHLEDIVYILPQPIEERRGLIYFKSLFEGYNLQ